MNKTINLDRWLGDPRSVAAVAPAEALFGLLRRSFKLPASFGAIASRRSAAPVIYASGKEVASDDVTEILFVRAQPVEVSWHVEQLAAQDRYLCEAEVTVQLRVLLERGELDSFRGRVMGSGQAVDILGLGRYLGRTVEDTLRGFVERHPAAALLGGKANESGAAALAEGLRGPCFAGGMCVESGPTIRFSSESYATVRQAEERAARQLSEHRAQTELRQAIAGAQREKLDHLETMLTRLKALADDSPDVSLPELMRAFDESQRGQLYHALFESGAKAPSTQWIAVVSGLDLLLFDPRSAEKPVRRVGLDGPAGPLRSIRLTRSADAVLLLVGAARGVYEIDVDSEKPNRTHLFEAPGDLHGGVNAAALNGADLVATHSEAGLLHWNRDESGPVTRLLTEMTGQATAVRNAQFAAGCLWCSIDQRIVSVPADNLYAVPQTVEFGQSFVTSLCVCDGSVYAGTADGEVWCCQCTPGALPQLLHGGSRRAAESLGVLATGGVARLFYTDTSLAVFTRVIGDTFACRYEAGGQTIRRAQAADDCIVAMNDARDRVIIWSPGAPRKPAAVIAVSRFTGRSVQDVCLVPVS